MLTLIYKKRKGLKPYLILLGINLLQTCIVAPSLPEKSRDSENCRVIDDLSWPKGNSINDFVVSDQYMGTKFMLTFPSIDDITAQVIRLGRGCLLYKVKIS